MKRSTKILIGVGVVLVIAAAILIPLWQLGYFTKKHTVRLGPGGLPPSSINTCNQVENVIIVPNGSAVTVTVATPFGMCRNQSVNFSMNLQSQYGSVDANGSIQITSGSTTVSLPTTAGFIQGVQYMGSVTVSVGSTTLWNSFVSFTA